MGNPNPEFRDMEPVADFIQKIGKRTNQFGTFEVNLIEAGHLTHDRVVVYQSDLNLFAAQLFHASPELYQAFLECFPEADAGAFVGP